MNATTSQYNITYPPLQFDQFVNSSGQVVGHLKQTFTGRDSFAFERPMGCCFDPGLRRWIVTDKNLLHLFDDREATSQSALNYMRVGERLLRYPSAVAILRPGESVVVLEDGGIWIYDLRTNHCRRHFVFDTEKYRGLTVVDDSIVSIYQQGEQSEIVFFSSKKPYTIEERFPYETTIKNKKPSPSFLDACGSHLCVTDLGVSCFTTYRYHRKGLDRWMQRFGPYYRPGCGDGLFGCISGVRMDTHREMWIGDARNNSLQWMDADGNFKSRIHFRNDNFAAVSSFAVSVESQRLLVCCRKTRHVKLYDLAAARPETILVNVSVEARRIVNLPA